VEEAPWTESRSVTEDVILSFRAVDQDAADAVEMRTFMRDVQTRSEEHESRGFLSGGKGGGSLGGVVVATAVAAAYGALMILPTMAAVGVCAGAGAFAGAAALVERRKKNRDRAITAPASYEIAITLDHVDVRREGASIVRLVLDQVEAFSGAKRLDVHLRDGTTKRLSLALLTPGDHPAFAQRLTELVVRARTSRGGYR
jgi:hypothetical protein